MENKEEKKKYVFGDECEICHRPINIPFHVPDDVWNEVIPIKLRDKHVCLSCFITKANTFLIEWEKDIEFFPKSLVTEMKEHNMKWKK